MFYVSDLTLTLQANTAIFFFGSTLGLFSGFAFLSLRVTF